MNKKILLKFVLIALFIGVVIAIIFWPRVYNPNTQNLLKYGPSTTIFKTVRQNQNTDFNLITIPKDCNIIYIGVKGNVTTTDLKSTEAFIRCNAGYFNILKGFSKYITDSQNLFYLNKEKIDIQFTNLNIPLKKDDIFYLQLFSNGNKIISIQNLYVEIEMS